MLFVQDISLTYYKDVRYANYANARNEIKFAPVKIEKIPDCEVFYQKVGMFQDIDGIKKVKHILRSMERKYLILKNTSFIVIRFSVISAYLKLEILIK